MSGIRKGIPTHSKDCQNLLVLLKDAQSKFGYLPQEYLTELANSAGFSISDVYGVATFYSFLSSKPLGRNVIRVCKSLPCYLRHSQKIVDCLEQAIGIRPGETTLDGRFTFQLTNCIGACDKAPAMMVNHDVYGDLTPKKIAQVLAGYE